MRRAVRSARRGCQASEADRVDATTKTERHAETVGSHTIPREWESDQWFVSVGEWSKGNDHSSAPTHRSL
jgi:hypothetical protein